MARTVRLFLPVTGHPDGLLAAFSGDPARWLPNARPDGPRRFVLSLRAGSFSREVRANLGSAWHAGDTSWRSVSWDPIDEDGESGLLERFLPSLDGELGLHRAGETGSTLVFDARYRPPGGQLGAAIDATMLRRVARTTVQDLLEAVTARLSAEALLHESTSVSN
ncbi:MAG: hypothetical protein JJT89_14480 [Nitriliruptoraceae bacterium]|nr:hypothetical protein [Nitriliruptoraceae bacterium]